MDEEMAKQAEQLRYVHNIYMQEYEALISTLSNYATTANAISRNIEFIERSESLEGKEMLLNLEGGAYMKVQPKDTSTFLTYVGSGYFTEKSREDARRFLAENMKKSNDIISKLNIQKERLESEILEAEYRIGALEQG